MFTRPIELVSEHSSEAPTPRGGSAGGQHNLNVDLLNEAIASKMKELRRDLAVDHELDEEFGAARRANRPDHDDRRIHVHAAPLPSQFNDLFPGFGEDTLGDVLSGVSGTPVGTPRGVANSNHGSLASSQDVPNFMRGYMPSSPSSTRSGRSASQTPSSGSRRVRPSAASTVNSILQSVLAIASTNEDSVPVSGAATPASVAAPAANGRGGMPASFLMPPPSNTAPLPRTNPVGLNAGGGRSAPRQSNIPASSRGGRGGRRNGRGGARGGSRHNDGEGDDHLTIDEQNALIVADMTESYQPLLVGTVTEFDRRPWDDRAVISDAEAEAKKLFINEQHALWFSYDPTDDDITRYFLGELKAVDTAVNKVMKEATENQGGAVVTGIRLHASNAISNALASTEASDRAKLRQLFSEEELQEMMQSAGIQSAGESTFDITPTNLMYTRIKIALDLTSARDLLCYNYVDSFDEREKVTTTVAEIILRLEAAVDRACAWIILRKLDKDKTRMTCMEMAALQSEQLLKNPRASLVLLLSTRMKASLLKRGQQKDHLYQEEWFKGRRTHFWRPVVSIAQWIAYEVSLTFGVRNLSSWLQAHFSGGVEDLARKFSHTKDPNLLCAVDPNMDIHSFANGIYDIALCQWMPFDSEVYKQRSKTGIFAYNFHPVDFRFGAAFNPVTGIYDSAANGPVYDPLTRLRDRSKPLPPLNWFNVKVDGASAFLDAQNFDYDTKLFIWFSIGRTHRPKSRDRYQYDLFIQGTQGVGKSMFIKQCAWVHPREYQRHFGTKIEETFGMQDLLNPDGTPAYRIAIATEIGAEFRWSSGELNVQVEGGECGVPVKNGAFIPTIAGWEIPFLFGGNTTFPYSSKQMPAVIRRWPHVFVVNRPVGESPTEEMFVRASDALLYVSSTARLEFERAMRMKRFSADPVVKAAGSSNYIWDHAPPYFHETKRKLLTIIPGVTRMIVDSMWLVHTNNPDDIVSISSLVDAAWLYFTLKKGGASGNRPSKESIIDALQISYEPGIKFASYEQPVACELDGSLLEEGEYVRGFRFGANPDLRDAIVTASKHNGFNELLGRIQDLKSRVSFEHGDEEVFGGQHRPRDADGGNPGYSGGGADGNGNNERGYDAGQPRQQQQAGGGNGRPRSTFRGAGARRDGPLPPRVVGHENQTLGVAPRH